MNRALIDPIANAVLYEGYILYPYRPSTQHRPRWTFGGLYPPTYCAPGSGESSLQQTECLVVGTPETRVEVVVRFLHLTARQVVAIDAPMDHWPGYVPAMSRAVETLRVGDQLYRSWQEAEEREVNLGPIPLRDLLRPGGLRQAFAWPGGVRCEPLSDAQGSIVGALARDQEPISGDVEVVAVDLGDGLHRLSVVTANLSPLEASSASRDQAMLRSLTASHAILGVEGGAFVSLMAPPDRWRAAAASCRNLGAYPVLVGAPGRAEMMLSASLILYDHPEVAPATARTPFDDAEVHEPFPLGPRHDTLRDLRPLADSGGETPG